LTQAGAIAVVSIDNPAAIEPSHWPAAYARTVTIREGRNASQRSGPLALRISYESAAKLFAETSANGDRGLDGAEILANGLKGRPLGIRTLTYKMRISLKTTEKDISSPNIIAVLPGTDTALASEYVAVSAHLDGYGFGTPVMGDNLYNGALDDAAYVATLLDMADIVHGKPPARSLLFCIFAGEEKGLLGSVYYTQHLTVPKGTIVADLNLDQLRPIFPLKILTMEGIADSTIGDTAKSVAKSFNIELRPDRETERRLFSRSDNYSFVRIGVPIGSFIFGYDPGTEEERIYRDWYARRYHKPQDDLATPIDWDAAVKFNDFYRALVLAIANNPKRPEWRPTSAYAPKSQ
jgi:Zn-dependent M28 family amino/carboxypeptidase